MLTPNWYPGPKQLRQFAGFSLLTFLVLGLVVWHTAHSVLAASVLWGIGGLVALVGLPFPRAIRPFYALLIGLTVPIGWVISNLLLRVIFYGIFTPLGLIFRVFGRDALLLKRPSGETFWRPYPRPKDVASYYRQT